MEGTETSLVAGMIEGNEQSWEDFGRRSKPLVLARIKRTFAELNYNPPSVDTCCEITSALHDLLLTNDKRALKSFQGRSKLSTWLTVIIRRVTIQHLATEQRLAKKRDRETALELVEQKEKTAQEHQGRLKILKLAKSKLSVDDQEILKLHYERELSYSQIAKHLRISTNAVGPKLSRARTRLRDQIRRVESSAGNTTEPRAP